MNNLHPKITASVLAKSRLGFCGILFLAVLQFGCGTAPPDASQMQNELFVSTGCPANTTMVCPVRNKAKANFKDCFCQHRW